MTAIRIVALIGLTAGLFTVFGIGISDFAEGLFGGLLKGRGGLREEVLREAGGKRESSVARGLREVQSILRDEGREGAFAGTCALSVALFASGALLAAFLGNGFLIPVFAIGFMMIPFWYVRLSASHYKKTLAAELETALSVITTAYLRSEDVITSVEENIRYLNPPVKGVFAAFLSRVRLVDSDVDAALEELKGKIPNAVFAEWVDALRACQADKSLKATLVPIVTKLSDARIVNAELDFMVTSPRKEFLTMAVLVVSNVPLTYFLNKDWFHALTGTLPGKITMALCGAAIFISTAFVVRLTRPIEYQN